MINLTNKIKSIVAWYSDRKNHNCYIPENFNDLVLKHILCNYLSITFENKTSPPLFLGIQGPKGEGKSFITKEICFKNRISIIYVSGATLSGSKEADSLTKFQAIYEKACFDYLNSRQMLVILVDDFHMSDASFSNVNHTINSQLLVGYLMNIADNNLEINDQEIRVPIIFTGNNFTDIYSPLTRHGRMDLFSWIPTDNQKYEIIKVILYNVCKLYVIDELFRKYSNQAISFFSQLKNDIISYPISKYIEKCRCNNTPIEIENAYTLYKPSSISDEIIFYLAEAREKMSLYNWDR